MTVDKEREPSMWQKHFNATTIVAITALVFAMTGGAFAITNHHKGDSHAIASIAKKKKSKAKVLRGPRGPKGETGPAGPQGPEGKAGLNGKDGTNGTNGKDGLDGKDGANGTNGASVTSKTINPGEPACNELGGSEFTVGSSVTFACNGASGGSSSGPLPSGHTLTGVWSTGSGSELLKTVEIQPGTKEIEAEVEGKKEKLTVVTSVSANEIEARPVAVAAISFPVEVASSITTLYELNTGTLKVGIEIEKENSQFYKLGAGGPTEAEEEWLKACPGNFEKPQAAPGFLCIYPKEGPSGGLGGRGAEKPFLEAAHPFGLLLPFELNFAETRARGSWAVTAE